MSMARSAADYRARYCVRATLKRCEMLRSGDARSECRDRRAQQRIVEEFKIIVSSETFKRFQTSYLAGVKCSVPGSLNSGCIVAAVAKISLVPNPTGA